MEAQEVKKIIQDNDVRFVENHKCSLCEVPVGWEIHDAEKDDVSYKSACGCSYEPNRSSSFEEIARFYNIQSSPQSRESVLKSIKGESQ